MNHQEMRILLSQTISPDSNKRKQAEDALKELESNSNFILMLPETYMKDTDPLVKKVATVFFKNCVERNWEKDFFQEAKMLLMSNIVLLMLKSDQSVISYYLTIIQFIFEKEKPENLSLIFEKIPNCLSSDDLLENYVGINLVLAIQKDDNLKYNAKVVHPLVESVARTIFDKLISYLEIRNFHMARLYMKFLTKCARQYQVPEFFSELNFYSVVFNLSKKILSLSQIQEIEVLKLTKWSLRFISKGTEKAFKKFHKNPEITNLINNEESIKEIYLSCKMMIHNHMSTEVEYEKTVSAALEYVMVLCTSKKYSSLVLGDLYFFLDSLVLKKYIFSEKEENDYELPDSFLREKHSFYISSLKNLSGNFLDEITRKLIKKKEEFGGYMNYLKEILYKFLSNPEMENARVAYGALYMVAMSSHWISEYLEKEVSSFLENCIFPFLGCNFNFLKSQACYVLQYFSGEEIKEIIPAFNNVYQMLLSDDDVMKVDAVQCINFFFYNEKVSLEFKKRVPEMVKILIDLNNKYNLETLADITESLIANFASEVAQFAPSLILALTEIIKNCLVGEYKENIDVISGHLRTMETLFSSITHPETLVSMFSQIYPLIIFIFTNQVEDFFQEAIDILASFTFNLKFVDQFMWEIFEKIMNLEKMHLYNNVIEISNLVENFIIFGKNHILNENYFSKVMSFVELICSSPLDDFFQDDYNSGCRIMECLILHSENYVAPKIEDFLALALHNKSFFEKDSSCWVYCLNVIMHCYALNQEFTEASLMKFNFFSDFFTKIYEKRRLFKRVHDKKTVLLFIGILANKPAFQTDYTKLTKVMVSALKTLPSAIIKRNTLISKKEEYDEEEYYSEEDDMLEEDIYWETKLDKFDVFEFIKQVFQNVVHGSVGGNLVGSMDLGQKDVVQKIFSEDQPKQI